MNILILDKLFIQLLRGKPRSLGCGKTPSVMTPDEYTRVKLH